MTTKTPEPVEIGDFVLTRLEHADYTTRYTERSYSFLSDEHSLGTIEGLEIYVGLQSFYTNKIPNPQLPEHASFFEGYTKEEMSRYKMWDGGIYNQWYRHKKNLHEKQRWGFAGITLASFANGIQIGEIECVEKLTETGYAPSLNTFDLGTPIYLDESKTIAHWVENNGNYIKDFVEERREMAFTFIKKTIKKLNDIT